MLVQREDDHPEITPAPMARTTLVLACVRDEVPAYRRSGSYAQRARPNWTALAIAGGVQLLAIPLLLGLGARVLHKPREASVVAINLTPASSPAHPEAKDHRPQSKPTHHHAKLLPTPPVPPVATAPVAPMALAQATLPAAAPVRIEAPAPPAPAAPGNASPSAAVGGPQDLSGIRMLEGEAPRYPIESRRRKEQGTVRLRVLLGVDGRVKSISVAVSSGYARLDAAALKAVRTWRWAPILRGGVPVEIAGTLEIPFVLKSA